MQPSITSEEQAAHLDGTATRDFDFLRCSSAVALVIGGVIIPAVKIGKVVKIIRNLGGVRKTVEKIRNGGGLKKILDAEKRKDPNFDPSKEPKPGETPAKLLASACS